MYTPKKETSRIVKRDYRTEGLRSTSPKSRDYQGPSEFDGGFYGSQSKKGQETDAMTENIELKKLLND